MGNSARRSVIRRTWGQERRFSDVEVRMVFLLGSSLSQASLQAEVEEEVVQYGTLADQVPKFQEFQSSKLLSRVPTWYQVPKFHEFQSSRLVSRVQTLYQVPKFHKFRSSGLVSRVPI